MTTETPPIQNPNATYSARLAANAATAARAESQAKVLSNLRLAVFVVLLGLLIAFVFADWPGHALWLPLAAFFWLVIAHARASAEQVRAERAMALYEQGLARLEDRWSGRGQGGEALRPDGHIYAGDLDLFGPGSLFELLCVARTRVGQQRLADWLLTPASPKAIRARQGAVAELAPRLDLRERLALLEADVSSALERGAVTSWGEGPTRLSGRLWPVLNALLAAISTVLLVGWLGAGWKPLWMALSMALQAVLASLTRTTVHEVLEAADRPAQDLLLIGRVLEHLEQASFEDPYLRALHARLDSAGALPSRAIRNLTRLMDFVDARRNQIFLPISWLLSLGTQLAYRIETWRGQNGPRLTDWLDVVAEIEALASLAGYAYEHPADPFPVILDEGPVYEGTGVAHPLLPSAAAIPNDVHLSAQGAAGAPQALILSGSNMSGKSTLLRTLGVNAVLAYAGAPVRATSLSLSSLAVGASIQLHDSLQEGASRFYAEIGRLRQIVDLSEGERPALFLLDEILHGTNSHDRRIGAAAVVKTLLANGAIGIVTTHDLALAAIEDDSGSRVGNVHLEDHMEEGRMVFDYTLRPGVVTRSNALALMRAVGLKIAAQDD